METVLYGTNLCNILVNEIIKEFNSVDKTHISNITLCDLSQFIVLRGETTIQNPLNYSKLFNSFLSELCEIDRNFNIIDLITYNAKSDTNIVDIDVSFTTDLLSEPLVDTFPLFGYFEIDNSNNLIKHNNQKIYDRVVELPEFKEYSGLSVDHYKPYFSTDYFGKNLMSSKSYITYLKYITYNLFEKQLCKDIRFKLFYSGDINNINWETMSFEVYSESNITKIEWIESLILDLFDFKYSHIKKHLSLDEYDFNNEILSKDKCWMKRDKTSEMMLF